MFTGERTLLVSSRAVRAAAEPLVKLAAHHAKTEDVIAAALSERLLALPPAGVGKRGGRSIVSAEGLPVEYSVSSSGKGLRHRLMGDPAAVLADGAERYRRARQALEALLPEAGASALAPSCDALLRHMVRSDRDGLRRYPAGCCWLGAAIGQPGIALFITAEIPGRDPWPALERTLAAMLPDPAPSLRLTGALRPFARLAGVGLEGLSPHRARLKIYWRLHRLRPLAEMGVPLLAHPAFGEFLTLGLGDRELQGGGFLADTGFSLASGRLFDSKVFLCGHCLAYSAAEWAERMAALSRCFALPAVPVSELLGPEVAASFLAFGIDSAEQPRLNLYLKPRRRVPEA